MSRIRNPDWQEDEELHEDLQRYVLQNLQRKEVLDFVQRDYPQYSWSLPTLSRRMSHFGIKYVDYNIAPGEVKDAFRKENAGPGQLLGYRSMQKKIREEHNLAVPRGLVYDVMTDEDPDSLRRRQNVGRPKKRRGPTGTFTSLVSLKFQILQFPDFQVGHTVKF
jgi:hypothetical protein